MFAHVTGRVVCLSFHQSAAIDLARGLDLDGNRRHSASTAGRVVDMIVVGNRGEQLQLAIRRNYRVQRQGSPARPSSVLSMSGSPVGEVLHSYRAWAAFDS